MHITKEDIVDKGLVRALWSDVRDLYALPESTKHLIDAVPQSGKKQLYILSYRFGEQIATENGFQLPSAANGLSQTLLDDFRKNVCYARIPLALVAHNAVEVYRYNHVADQAASGELLATIPQTVLVAGEFFGLFELADYIFNDRSDYENPWNISAGARTLRLLLPLNDEQVGEDVARYIERKYTKQRTHFGGEPKKWTTDNWHLIRTIADYADTTWHCDILLFPENWLMGDDVQTSKFRKILVQKAWKGMNQFREAFVISDRIRREEQLQAKLGRFVKGSDHVCRDVLIHLLMMARGQKVAFTGFPDSTLVPIEGVHSFLDGAFAVRGARSKKKPALVLPTILRKSGDVGLFSIRQPLLEGLQIGGASWPRLMELFSDIVDVLQSNVSKDYSYMNEIAVFADFKHTPYICQQERADIAKLPEFTQLDNARSRVNIRRDKQLHLSDPFLSGLVRIVRG